MTARLLDQLIEFSTIWPSAVNTPSHRTPAPLGGRRNKHGITDKDDVVLSFQHEHLTDRSNCDAATPK